MSAQAVAWALAQPVCHSPAKFILVVLAHYAHGKQAPWSAFASTTLIAQQTGQDRKTVLANLRRLIDAGFLVDSGERAGATKSVVVFRLCEPSSSTNSGTASDQQSGTENGTASEAQAVPNFGQLSGTEIGIASDDFEGSSPKTGTAYPEAVPNLGHLGKPEAVPVFPTEIKHKKEVIPIFVGNTSKSRNTVSTTKRGSRLPADWVLPMSWGKAALDLRPDLSAEQVRVLADEFRDYWTAVPGAKGCKLDWLATWRNRVRTARAPVVPNAAGPRAETGKDWGEWWKSDAATDRVGRELGMFARGGETYASYRDRIFAELRRRRDEQEGGA